MVSGHWTLPPDLYSKVCELSGLKNLLFMKSDQDEFEALKKVWKEFQDNIFDAGEKPLRFLRYFIFSRYSVEARNGPKNSDQ